jgi:putative peptidoglycan lipid II flippase
VSQPRQRESIGRHAFLVGAGILLSRLVGLVRQRYFSHYFGQSNAADAFNQAFRIPNILQNLFGEGVLSASFIPVYSGLLAKKDEEEAGRLAGAIFAILALTTSVLVLAGVLAAPVLTYAIAPGFHGEKRELTVRLVRILFPSVGLLVISAWCLGILNSHRKFFLSYAAPVFANLVMIATILMFRRLDQYSLATKLAWGSVAGSAVQFAVQLPFVLKLVPRLRLALAFGAANVRSVIHSFGPVFVSRGVVQISGYVDQLLSSLLGEGAASALTNAQNIYMLPVSLFGMAVSAAELPAMSSAIGDQGQIAAQLRTRLNSGLRQIALFIVPSAMGFLALGGVITALLYQSGHFTHQDSTWVWGVLAGSSIGLVASTLGRLYSSTYYALRDTRTPLRFALIRVILTTGFGYLCAIPLPHWLGIDPKWGVAGLTASAGLSGWVEFALLRTRLNHRIGVTGIAPLLIVKLWISAAIAAAAGWGVKLALGPRDPVVSGIAILSVYGAVYFAATYATGVEECAGLLERFTRLRR